MSIAPSQKRLCPFILEPFENCYCAKMNSQDIERAVSLCNYNFESCEIYRKNTGNGNGNNNGENALKEIIEKSSTRLSYQ
jgi:hypothetical protein